jgi:hypothetical protein
VRASRAPALGARSVPRRPSSSPAGDDEAEADARVEELFERATAEGLSYRANQALPRLAGRPGEGRRCRTDLRRRRRRKLRGVESKRARLTLEPLLLRRMQAPPGFRPAGTTYPDRLGGAARALDPPGRRLAAEPGCPAPTRKKVSRVTPKGRTPYRPAWCGTASLIEDPSALKQDIPGSAPTNASELPPASGGCNRTSLAARQRASRRRPRRESMRLPKCSLSAGVVRRWPARSSASVRGRARRESTR